MISRLIFLALLTAALVWPALAMADSPAPAGKVVVSVEGLRSGKGMLRLSLFHGEKGFPGNHKEAERTASVPLKGEGTPGEVVFEGVKPGLYAVAVLHDENKNGKMDTNWVGIPREGGGASRNPKVRFGPPKFQQAAFFVRQAPVKLAVKVRYP